MVTRIKSAHVLRQHTHTRTHNFETMSATNSNVIKLMEKYFAKLSGKIELLEEKMERLGEELKNEMQQVVQANMFMQQVDKGEDYLQEEHSNQLDHFRAGSEQQQQQQQELSMFEGMGEDWSVSSPLQQQQQQQRQAMVSMSNDNGQFECPNCDRSFQIARSLRRHLKTKHSGLDNKLWECPKCGRGYTWQGNMIRHRKSCPGLAPGEQ